jgi:hypothetical protein
MSTCLATLPEASVIVHTWQNLFHSIVPHSCLTSDKGGSRAPSSASADSWHLFSASFEGCWDLQQLAMSSCQRMAGYSLETNSGNWVLHLQGYLEVLSLPAELPTPIRYQHVNVHCPFCNLFAAPQHDKRAACL